jgi:hypothetical protein
MRPSAERNEPAHLAPELLVIARRQQTSEAERAHPCGVCVLEGRTTDGAGGAGAEPVGSGLGVGPHVRQHYGDQSNPRQPVMVGRA